MTQLAPEEGVAVGGDPVEQTDAPENHAPVEEQNDVEADTTLDDLYPEDGDTAEPSEEEEQDPNVNDEAEDTDGEDAQEDDEDEPDDEPAIDPPHSWKAEEKERWASLPRETQAYLSEREAERERFVNSKAQEAAQARDTYAKQAQQELAQFSEQQAQQYQMLAQQFIPPEPDDRLLYTGNPNDQLKYQQQQAEHRSGLAQLQKLQQAAQVHASRAQQIREDHERAEQEQDAQRLREAMPEWFDETHHADLNNQLTATAKAMGYPEDRLPDADSADLLALRTANQWKEKAEKWDAYQKAKMKPVREAKKKAPIPNKPGSTNTGQTGAADPVKLLYPND